MVEYIKHKIHRDWYLGTHKILCFDGNGIYGLTMSIRLTREQYRLPWPASPYSASQTRRACSAPPSWPSFRVQVSHAP